MKKLFLFLLFGVTVMAQVTPPSGYTPNYGLRMWSQGANPSADSLNANWMLIDNKIKLAYDSANTSTLKTYGNYNIYGNRTYKSGYIAMDGARFLFGNSTVTSPLFVGEIAPTTARTYLTYTNVSSTDTFAMRDWVRDNFTFANTGYRVLWSDFVTNTTGNATLNEYQYANANSTIEATTYNIRIPFYKTGDEDSLICHFRAYYFLGTGNVANQIRMRFYIDGDPPFSDTFAGIVEITSDDYYGYANYTLQANISLLPVGAYVVSLAGSIDLDTYNAGVSKIYVTRPIIMVRY